MGRLVWGKRSFQRAGVGGLATPPGCKPASGWGAGGTFLAVSKVGDAFLLPRSPSSGCWGGYPVSSPRRAPGSI